jgi:hypothetical protein
MVCGMCACPAGRQARPFRAPGWRPVLRIRAAATGTRLWIPAAIPGLNGFEWRPAFRLETVAINQA